MIKTKIKEEEKVGRIEIQLGLKLVLGKYSKEETNTYQKLADLISKTINKKVTVEIIVDYYLPSIEYEDRLLIAKEHWPDDWIGDENFVN